MIDFARSVRQDYLTGTAIAIIVVLLVLLVEPTIGRARLARRCPVCDHAVKVDG